VASPENWMAGIPIPAEPARIEREISRFWDGTVSGETATGETVGVAAKVATRACLSNLVICLPDAESEARAARILPLLARRFPSRILLVTRADPAAGKPLLEASFTAMCHRGRPGAPPVCCEQITLRTSAESLDVVRGAVTPLLVPDVVAVLVLFGGADAEVIAALGRVVDRVVVDTRRLPLDALRRVAPGNGDSPEDLAWKATRGLRALLSDVFAEPNVRPIFESLQRLEVAYGDSPTCAAWLAGWLASRLGWHSAGPTQVRDDVRRTRFDRDGASLEIILSPSSVPSTGGVVSLELHSQHGATPEFLRLHVSDSDRVRVEYHTHAACVIPRWLALAEETDVELLGGALEWPTHRGVYEGALGAALEL